MKKSRQGFLKRQKELARQAKKRAKEEKKAARKDGDEEFELLGPEEGLGEPEGLDFHAADGVLAASVEAVVPGESTVEATEDPAEAEKE